MNRSRVNILVTSGSVVLGSVVLDPLVVVSVVGGGVSVGPVGPVVLTEGPGVVLVPIDVEKVGVQMVVKMVLATPSSVVVIT